MENQQATTISPSKYEFTIEEIRALYRLIEKEWIPTSDEEIVQVTKRITQIVDNELAK